MVKLSAVALLPAFTLGADISSLLSQARDVVNSAAYLEAFSSQFVSLQNTYLNTIEAAAGQDHDESVTASLTDIANFGKEDRVNYHCRDVNGRMICNAPFNLEQIWGYGCWCNFGANLLQGRGNPQNRYDQICRDFELCLRCARWDGKNEGYFCDPAKQNYTASRGNPDFIRPDEDNVLVAGCTLGNPGNDCATHTCMCEQTIISELVDIALEWPRVTEWEPTYLHDAAPHYGHDLGWDHEAYCPPPQGPNFEAECCGFYPKRFPYGVDNPNKDCCRGTNHESIYNPVFQDCCVDGSVMDNGACQ